MSIIQGEFWFEATKLDQKYLEYDLGYGLENDLGLN